MVVKLPEWVDRGLVQAQQELELVPEMSLLKSARPPVELVLGVLSQAKRLLGSKGRPQAGSQLHQDSTVVGIRLGQVMKKEAVPQNVKVQPHARCNLSLDVKTQQLEVTKNLQVSKLEAAQVVGMPQTCNLEEQILYAIDQSQRRVQVWTLRVKIWQIKWLFLKTHRSLKRKNSRILRRNLRKQKMSFIMWTSKWRKLSLKPRS